MTAQVAVAPVSTGATITKVTGATSGDTVPAGSTLIMINGGAGTHVVTLANNATNDGLATASRTHSIPNATAKVCKVPNSYGDVNGLVAISIDGTATEITYYVIAA